VSLTGHERNGLHVRRTTTAYQMVGRLRERGGSKLAKGINISMQYVEDENGVAIDGFRVKMILSASHQLFFSSGKSRGTQDMGCCWNRNTTGVL